MPSTPPTVWGTVDAPELDAASALHRYREAMPEHAALRLIAERRAA